MVFFGHKHFEEMSLTLLFRHKIRNMFNMMEFYYLTRIYIFIEFEIVRTLKYDSQNSFV